MADTDDKNATPVDEEAMAAEWEAMAGGDDKPDDDKVAAEWEAMAGGDDDGPVNAPVDRILDQDEIDSLLGFDGFADEGEKVTGVQALINSGLVAYERLPMLDIVFDRFVRMMSTSLRNFTSDNIEVSIDNTSSIRFGGFPGRGMG
jgi:flagellar motor switch protein FliM